MSEIERCPWCQSPASVKTSRDGEISTVSCDNGQCKAAGPREWSPEQAVAAWNTRSQSERVSRLVEALKEQHEAMADVMELRRLSSSPEQRAKAESAIAVWRKVDALLAALNQSDGGGNG